MKLIKRLLFGNDKPVLRNLISAILYCTALVALDIGFRHLYAEGIVPVIDTAIPVYFTLSWTAILCAVSFLLPRIVRRIYMIFTIVAYSVFALAHGFFYSFNGTYLTLSSAIFAGEGAAFFDWSYFSLPKKFILLVLICIFLTVIAALIIPKTKYSVIKIICSVLAFAAGITGTVLCKNAFSGEEGALVWDSALLPTEIYESFTDTRTCMHMVGLYQFTFRDVSNVTGLSDLMDKIVSGDTISALDTFYENKKIDPDNEMTGIFKDKSMIFIQLESIDTWMVNDISMPFFASLTRESINFENFYAPKFLAASTFNTEVIANTGLSTPVNSAKVSYFTENEYPYSAANLFKKAGYSVESYHRSNGSIYNRGAAHMNWGYSAYNNSVAMNMNNADLDTEMMNGYDSIVKDGKFMSFIITYSGHGPYSGESVEVKSYYDIIKPQLPADAEEEYIYALCHAYETDQFIKMLYERLEADGRLEDTVLVFYSDHYDHYVTDTNILIKYKGGSDTNLWCNIPFAIYHKGTEVMTVEKTVSTFDILPTIVNLFDLDTDGRYYVGNDAFSENGGYAFFQNGSWVEGDTYFNVNESTATEESARRAAEIREKLDMSWDTVKTNYFKKKGLN